MNAHCFKVVFSKRLGQCVPVGESSVSQGKGQGARAGTALVWRLWGTWPASTVSLACLVCLPAWAQPAPTALPSGSSVAAGVATVSSSGASMAIRQGSDRAIVNWQSFNIGKEASVLIVQPGSQSVLLNRVTGESPSQIFGQLSANGQVVLVNPNGVTFGKDGSVSAAGFTASTLGISDADFMAGRMRYERNGSTAGIVHQGKIATQGGYVALLGASVDNEGRIETRGGAALLGAAESVKVPLSHTGRIKLELTPAHINASVANQRDGVIVTEGGQVYMQAAAVNSAIASVLQSGGIDTSAAQAGAVHVLADGGQIKVDGSITANSTGQDIKGLPRPGGSIVIGRDEETGVLARQTDVSGARLESLRGFVETSGHWLKTDGVQIKASEWLLDPNDIEINASSIANTAGNSVVTTADIVSALNVGTSVTISTGTGTGSLSSSTAGQAVAGTTQTLGNIWVNNQISATNNGAGAATLTLAAANNITVGAGIYNNGSQALNLTLNANGGSISGTGAIGATSGSKIGTVTVTQSGSSTYQGAINAQNFTLSGGNLTLASWVQSPSVNTNISNAYTVQNGATLAVTPSANYPQINPASVNVVNASTFTITPSSDGGTTASNGWWKGTSFNFTGGSGGGTLNLGGNPISSSGFTNTFSTSGGATNVINGTFNASTANVNLNLSTANSGTQLLDGTYAALHFAQSSQGGFGLSNAATVTMSGGGNLLINDKTSATNFNVNAGSVQIGTGANELASTTPTFAVINANIASGSSVTFNKLVAHSNSTIFTGNGNLYQANSGTVTLTGNSSAFAGNTYVKPGYTLGLGNDGSLGAAGSTLNLDSSASTLLISNTSGTSTVGSTISGPGVITKSGGGIGVLAANNSYTGATSVSTGTLQVGNAGSTGTLGAGDVTLSNNATLSYVRATATTIANNISGTGNVSATITGASSDLTTNHTINLTGGTVNLVTDGNLSVTQAIRTTNSTSGAVFLESGKATAAGIATGGDITISGGGTVTVGSGGRITYMTGSIAGSTGLGIPAGYSRYNSDEVTTNYTTPLGSGTYAIYREAPILTATLNNASKTYDSLAYSGGNGISALSGFVNGDNNAQLGAITYGGTSQGDKNAGTYTLTGSAVSGVGYAVALTAGTLTVNKANLTINAQTDSRAYDGTTASSKAVQAVGLQGSDSLAATQSFDSKNAGPRTLAVNNGYVINDGNSGNNYTVNTATATGTIAKANASVRGTPTNVTYNGQPQTQGAPISSGFVTGDAITISGTASGKNAGSYTSALNVTGADAGNYNITISNADLVIDKAALTVTGNSLSSTYNGQTQSVTGWTANGLLGTDTTADLVNVTANGASGRNAGSYTNTVTAGTQTNYIITTQNGSLDIAKANASVSGTTTNVTYNGQTQTQGAPTSSGFVMGDAITISGTASGKNAGSYTSVLNVTGADAGNYNVSITNADLTIARKDVTLAAITAASKTYDGHDRAAITGGAVAGTVEGETLAVSGTGTFDSQNAGTGKTVTVTDFTQLNPINGSGDWSNYRLTTHGALTTTASIAPKSITVSGITASDKVYDSSTAAQVNAAAARFNGMVNGDDLSVSAQGRFTDKNAGVGKEVALTSTYSGRDLGNYTITDQATATATIHKAALTLTGNSLRTPYTGQTQHVTGYTVSGLQGSDTVADLLGVLASGAYARDAGIYTNSVTADQQTNYDVTVKNGSLQIDNASPNPNPNPNLPRASLPAAHTPDARLPAPQITRLSLAGFGNAGEAVGRVGHRQPLVKLGTTASLLACSSDEPSDECICQDALHSDVEICQAPGARQQDKKP